MADGGNFARSCSWLVAVAVAEPAPCLAAFACHSEAAALIRWTGHDPCNALRRLILGSWFVADLLAGRLGDLVGAGAVETIVGVKWG